MSGAILLLSIRPEHAAKIFDGSKKVELRRVRPKIASGDSVLIYVSTPVQALVGAFDVERVMEAHPQVLWDQVKEAAGINREQFDSYYQGAAIAYGIFLREVRQLPKQIKLDSLRTIFSGFHPPQSYRYISEAEVAVINSKSHQIMKRDLLQKMPTSVRY